MSPPPGRVLTVGLVVPLLTGAAFLIYAGVTWFQHLSEAADSLTADGTVVAVRAVKGVKNQIRYKPFVHFADEAGRTVEIAGSSAHSEAVYPVGSTVNVRYPRGRPEDGWIDDFANVIAVPATLGVMGTLTLVVCAGIALRRVLKGYRRLEESGGGVRTG